MPGERPPDMREMGIYFTLAQVGVEMVVPLVVGLVIDYYAGTMPWLTMAGMVVGFVGGIVHIVVLANQQEAARRDRNKRGENPP
jgi:F0F1-type ATP synthase assembly protein I